MPGAGWSGVLYSPAVVTASDGDPAGGVSVSRGGAGHTATACHSRKEGWYLVQLAWQAHPVSWELKEPTGNRRQRETYSLIVLGA